MLTKNWYEYFRTYMGFAGNQTANEWCKAVDVNGVQYSPMTYSSSYNNLFPLTIFSNTFATKKTAGGLHFGDGSAQPTSDDYYLSGNQITTLSRSSQVLDCSAEGDTAKTVFTFTVKNTGTSAVTVREIAWVMPLRVSGNSDKYFMLDRTVIDEPVTIAAGDYAIIRYTISCTMPVPT